ncbi:MAG: hypothetical protein V4508_21920 [Pseudomonadota bacterium]
MPGLIRPSKEQVRAYMAARGSARRPPPAPEEIRRQLGWSMTDASNDAFLQFYLIPTTCSQLATRMALHWWLLPMGDTPHH